MVMSGWKIYNASPLFDFSFPNAITLGGWLGGALQWHFAAMWLLALNGMIYLAYGILSGHLRRRMFPITPRAMIHDVFNALRGRLAHDDLSVYNAAQKACLPWYDPARHRPDPLRPCDLETGAAVLAGGADGRFRRRAPAAFLLHGRTGALRAGARRHGDPCAEDLPHHDHGKTPGGKLGQGGKWNRKQYKTDSFHRSYPFTHTTCFKVCTTSTRSLWFAITSSMSL